VFRTTAQLHLYSTWSAPLWLAGVGVVVCLAAGVYAAMQAERAPRLWLLPLALTPLLGLVLATLGIVPPLVCAELGKVEALQGAGPHPWWAFRGLILGEVGAWLAAVAAVATGVAVRCFLGGPWRRPEHLAPIGIAALGLLLALAAPIHASMLLAWGPLPTLEATDGARVHTGHQLDLEPRVTGTLHPERCATSPLLFAPTEPGEVTLSARAHCGLFGVSRPVTAIAGEDRAPETFPLAVGHRWSWKHVREWHNHMLWFFPEHGRSEGPELHLQVTGQDDGGPLHTWTLREWVDEAEDVTHTLYAWDGALYERADAGTADLAFYRLLGDPELADTAAVDGDPDEPAWRPCDFGLFPDQDCRCLLEPHAEAGLPGPTLCHRPAGAGDDLRAIGSALLAVMTVGLVIVDPDQDPHWVLVGSSQD
jgi:hypothetical protein